jgi:nicotinate-nucleotide--dimethylbenzimidazole phosphoribosyltransferase
LPLSFDITAIEPTLRQALQNKIDQKTKPQGSLGRLEALALQIGLIQNTLTPELKQPSLIVFAGDHGIAEAGVSAFPQAVTAQMVANFLAGGAAINIFARQHGLELIIVDAGVNADIAPHPHLIQAKIAKGTQNCLNQVAMTEAQAQEALQKGAEIVAKRQQNGCNTIAFGEMGIGNTSAAALIMQRLTRFPLAQCVGRGTGLTDVQLAHKLALLQQALDKHPVMNEALSVLSTFGGFEIAMITGAYLKAAELKMLVIVDGFIASAALLVASTLYPAVLDYCVFSHVSNEQGHQALLAYFSATPLLNLDMRLGEGSGAAIAYPLLQSAVAFLNGMASFEEAGVSDSGK